MGFKILTIFENLLAPRRGDDMARTITVKCNGCWTFCCAVPLVRDEFVKMARGDRDDDVFDEIVYLRGVYIFCIASQTYKLFELP